MTQELFLQALPGVEIVHKLDRPEFGADGLGVSADIYWVRFSPVQYGNTLFPVEGKLYVPQASNGELVHMSPGFPGGNAGRMETKFVSELVDEGYAVTTHRFNGTSFQGPDAEEVFNCPERLELARQRGERHVGGTKPHGWPLASVVLLPATVMLALHRVVTRIHFVGHSMGAAANYNSVDWFTQNCPEIAGKVGKIISLAGYTGQPAMSPDGAYWDGLNLPIKNLVDYELERVQKKDVNFPLDPMAFRAGMWQIAQMNGLAKIPAQARQVLWYSAHDPIIHCPEPTENPGPVGTRKVIIRDERGGDDESPHSMLWVTGYELELKLRREVPEGGPHYEIIRR